MVVPSIAMIVACDPFGVIGNNGGLPWNRLEGDLARFKQLTMNCPVIMGRKTVESLPIKLKDRLVIQLSHTATEHLPNADTVTESIDKALVYGMSLLGTRRSAAIKDSTIKVGNVWIAGGAECYKLAWKYIEEIHVTQTKMLYEGDTRLPVLMHLIANELPDWELVSKEEFSDNIYYVYKRI